MTSEELNKAVEALKEFEIPLGTPPIATRLTDNSACTTLGICDRKYQLTCVHGFKPLHDNEYLVFGSAVHRAIEYMHKDGLEPLVAVMRIFKEFSLSEEDFNKILPLLQQFKSSFVLGTNPHMEQKLLLQVSHGYTLCGTIDHRDIFEGYLRIVDYKTCWDKMLARVLGQYQLSSQLRFYDFLLRRLADQILDPESLTLWQEGRVAYHYCLLSPLYNEIKMSPPMTFSEYDRFCFDQMLEEKIQHADKIWQMGDIPALKTGMWNGGCKQCNFAKVCIEQDPQKENEVLYHMRREPYDPTNFR